tara:strand:- start:69 stop:512 length:444 start_codon:yes stop_codon:yes gene_type:complete
MGIHCNDCSDETCGEDHVYAILLPSDKFPSHYERQLGRGWVYVGRTDNLVKDRFDSNFNPKSKAYRKKWAEWGITKENCRLIHEMHSCFNPVRKGPQVRDKELFRGNTATYAEYHLSKLFFEAGFCVDGDGLMAFDITPKKLKNKSM